MPECNSNDVLSHAPAISQKNQEPKTITHNDEKIALVLFLAGGFTIWNIFHQEPKTITHNDEKIVQ